MSNEKNKSKSIKILFAMVTGGELAMRGGKVADENVTMTVKTKANFDNEVRSMPQAGYNFAKVIRHGELEFVNNGEVGYVGKEFYEPALKEIFGSNEVAKNPEIEALKNQNAELEAKLNKLLKMKDSNTETDTVTSNDDEYVTIDDVNKMNKVELSQFLKDANIPFGSASGEETLRTKAIEYINENAE